MHVCAVTRKHGCSAVFVLPVECPEVPACARPEDSKFLLQCEHCPASYHYCCAGYYDSNDGPQRGQRWLCWRCSHDAPRGFQRNWVTPISAASPENMVYISEESGATVFRAATVIQTHGTYIAVQFQSNMAQEPHFIARESACVWHGSLSRLVWEERKCQATGEQLFTPKSRQYCPLKFKQLAEQHGVPVPEHLVDPQPILAARPSAQQASTAVGQNAIASSSQPSRRSTRAGQYVVPHQVSAEDAGVLEAKGQQWLEAVRSFGERVKDRVLINMPEFMALRRDLFVHSYAVWVVVMTWGGEEVVCENKLWSALAGVFDAPMTMTNRAQKMKQVWTQFRLARLTKADAQTFSEKLEVPPIDGDLLFAKSHPIAQQWPGCKRTQLPEDGAVGRASSRGTSMAGGSNAAQGKNGVASSAGRGASRGRGKGRGGQRGRKRLRSASDSDHDRSVEPESSQEPEEDEEEADEFENELIAPQNSPPRPARPAPKKQAGGKVRKQHVRRTESGQTELSDDDEDVGGARRASKRATSPRNSDDSQDPEAAAGTMLVAEGASRLRRMPLSALPPKMPPGLDLPEGAISSEFARQLRLGDYMIRLDSSCIHTSLRPRDCALELAKKGLRGESPKIQFVSTEKDFLGGWWDATLRGARTGSVLEGGARFLVEENYPGDPDDPFPQTWVPLVYYGPQPYPFQTPQVMIRPVPDWKPAASREGALKVQLGDLVEAVEVPEEQEDTVFWRGCVHELKPDGQVVVRLLVAPYGNAGVSTDPEEQESNYQTHPPERLRKAPLDDLMGMVREPSDDPDKGEIRAVATTDQMELQVLQHTKLIVGRYAGGKGVVAMEAHATFKTAQAAHPDDQDLAKVIKNRKSSTHGTRKRSLSAAISAAYKARVGGKPVRSTGVCASAGANGSRGKAQNEAANGSRLGRVGAAAAHGHGRGFDAATEILEAQLSGAGVSPLQSHHTHSSDGADGWAHRKSADLQHIGMQQLVRQQSTHEGRMSDSAALDSYRSSGRVDMHSTMQLAGPMNTAGYPAAPPSSSRLPSYGSASHQSGGLYSNDGASWDLSALAQMTGAHGAGVQYSRAPCPQQLMNSGHVQNYINANPELGRESVPQWGEQQQHGQVTQHMMPGHGTFPGSRGPHV